MRANRDLKLIIGVFGGGFALLLIAFAIGTAVLSARIDRGSQHISVKLDAVSSQLAEH